MRVIKRGVPKDDRVYEATCTYCDSVFEFKRSEAQIQRERSETLLRIECPVCGKNAFAYERSTR